MRVRGVASGEQCVGVASGAGWGRGPWEEAAKRGRAESALLFLWRPRRAEPGELAAGSALDPRWNRQACRASWIRGA